LIHGSHVELIATPGSAQHPSIAGNAVRLPLGPSPKRVSFKGYATLITRKTHHRSPKRKLATTLVGGPLGYMLFGRSTRLEQGREAPLAVTNRASTLTTSEFRPTRSMAPGRVTIPIQSYFSWTIRGRSIRRRIQHLNSS